MPPRAPKKSPFSTTDQGLEFAIQWLAEHGTQKDLANLTRFGITAAAPFGVSMANIRILARSLGRDHALAAALWGTGRYEARLLTAFVDEPALVTEAQMDAWCREFDNWAVCDTLCFHLFNHSAAAWSRVRAWSREDAEFVKRAGFALLACLPYGPGGDAPFLEALPLIEAAAGDGRNFVKKGVSWALRSVGQRSVILNQACVALARRLAESPEPAARWIGRGAAKELTGPIALGRAQRRPPSTAA